MNPESPEKPSQHNFDPQSSSLANADSGDATVSMQQNGAYENYSWAKSSDEYHASQDVTMSPKVQGETGSGHDVFLGATIGDHYQILSRLGSGGMSVVYKARHTLLHRNMAVKFLLPESDLDSKTLSRFQQEAKAAFTLNHPNIARVNELGIEGGAHPYIVMDFVEGPTLGEIIDKDGPMSVERTCSLLSQACAGLEHAHSKDIIHRDIKPGNLIITKEGGAKDQKQTETLKIVDFGIAKIMHEAEGTQHLTQTGEVFGSPLYMSPEQAMGKPLDARCDIYAMGCVLYEALAGKPPFRGANILDTLTKHINDEPEPLTNTPASMRVIVKRAMEKDPKDRYQTMTEFRNDLEAVLEGNQSKLTSTIKLLIKPKVRKWLVPVSLVAVALSGALIWAFPEVAASPRFDHRTATSWMWVPEPKSAEAPASDSPANSDQPTSTDNSENERSFGDVKNDNQKDRVQLALRVGDGDRAYEKQDPKPDDFKSAIASYQWASDNWDTCNTNSNYTGSTDWDRAMCESRLADCYRLTGDLEKAVAHYKIAKPLWSGLGDPAKSNDAICGLNIAFIESQLKTALSQSPAATWDNLSKVFPDSKYLGVVRQDWSNVQWNMGSAIDSEVSRVQAVLDRNNAAKKPFADLPLAKS